MDFFMNAVISHEPMNFETPYSIISGALLWGLMGKYLGFSSSDWRLGEINYLSTIKQGFGSQTTITKQTHFNTQNNHVALVDFQPWPKGEGNIILSADVMEIPSLHEQLELPFTHTHTHTRAHTLLSSRTDVKYKEFQQLLLKPLEKQLTFFSTVSAVVFWVSNIQFVQSNKCHALKRENIILLTAL